MRQLPASNTTSRGCPFWDTHESSKLLEEDEESGRAKELKLIELWKSRLEYQDFPLDVFRKHIYQLRYKRLIEQQLMKIKRSELIYATI
jgi:hypothetical protein